MLGSMQHEKITPQLWMLLARETREHLAKQFKVPKSGVTEIRDQELISDGRTMIDLEVFTREAMCEYVESDETFGRAFELVIAKAHSELHPPIGVIKAKEVEITVSVDTGTPEKIVVVEEIKEVTETPPKKKSYYIPKSQRKPKQNVQPTQESK